MPATPNDQNPFVEGDLNQELIDQMLNGGTVEQDPWSDETLQAEIDAARITAGVSSDFGQALPSTMPTPIAAGAERPAPPQGRTPTAGHPVPVMPLTPEMPPNQHANGIQLLMDAPL